MMVLRSPLDKSLKDDGKILWSRICSIQWPKETGGTYVHTLAEADQDIKSKLVPDGKMSLHTLV
jgi:hypothetical protein